jgi:hypothetical protein
MSYLGYTWLTYLAFSVIHKALVLCMLLPVLLCSILLARDGLFLSALTLTRLYQARPNKSLSCLSISWMHSFGLLTCYSTSMPIREYLVYLCLLFQMSFSVISLALSSLLVYLFFPRKNQITDYSRDKVPVLGYYLTYYSWLLPKLLTAAAAYTTPSFPAISATHLVLLLKKAISILSS